MRRTDEEIARTRAFWAASKPSETPAPALRPDPPPWWHVALALTVALLVQASLAPFIAFRGATISFVTLVAAWYGLRTGVARGLAFGLFAGACEDALGGATGVAWTFATGLAGALAGRLFMTSLADSIAALSAFAAGLTLVRYVAFAIAMHAQDRPVAFGLAHAHAALWQSALDGLAAFAILRAAPPGILDAHRR